jgi:hypothetical protein
MGAGLAGVVVAAGVMAITAPGLIDGGRMGGGKEPGTVFHSNAGQVRLAGARDRDWDDKGWDKGGEGRGRRAASRREQRAFEFIQEFYRRATESTPDAYKFIAAAYAPEVNYYGKKRSREGVLADKFAWMERWPVRDYRVQEESAEWQCNESARLCVVKVIVDFDARNPATGKVSKGVTTNELGVAVSNNAVEIEYENGKVLARR